MAHSFARAFARGLVATAALAGLAGASRAAAPIKVPEIRFSTAEFGRLPPGQNFGEVLAVAVNSNGHVVVLNHPGTATSGPLYGNATTQLLEFGPDGTFLREIGRGVYGLGYGHSVRFDRYDNLWVVDKGTSSVMKFDPSGKVVLNLGRRLEGYDSGHYEPPKQSEVTAQDGWFRAPTDVAWDADDNIYVSDGYVNSRIAKFNKEGDWISSWGRYGSGGPHADQNPGAFNNPHNMQIDRQGHIYVADRGNRRIQVFDRNGKFERFIFLNAVYDKAHHPTLGELPKDVNERPDESAPWALCISPTPTQYLFVVDQEPGRLYKMRLDGTILGELGLSGHRMGQFNWPHSLACPTADTVFVADMNNWRVQKLHLLP